MIDLIYDCDITMGLPGRDVDDGLALLYLLGTAEIRLLGVTSTFGNSSIQEVHPCLLSVLKDLGRSDIPAFRGASKAEISSHHDSGDRDGRGDSDAARFLAESVRRNPETVSVLATGSPTNLLGAYHLHPGFFRDVKEIVFMGGVTEPLVINGREMAELNFASDPEAALYALYAGQPAGVPIAAGETPPEAPCRRCAVTVISGNLCLQALLTRIRFDSFIGDLAAKRIPATAPESRSQSGYASYLKEKILPWFSWIEKVYGLPGFHAWDATAALYLTDPQLFESADVVLRSGLDDLKTGLLRVEPAIDTPAGGTSEAVGAPADAAPSSASDHPWRINLPTNIRDLPGYWRRLFNGWAGSAWPG